MSLVHQTLVLEQMLTTGGGWQDQVGGLVPGSPAKISRSDAALPLQVRKILQFYEATMQRMGVMIVGPSGCGKSTIWRVLQKALACVVATQLIVA